MKNTLSISLLSILLFSCSKDYETGTVKDYGAQANVPAVITFPLWSMQME